MNSKTKKIAVSLITISILVLPVLALAALPVVPEPSGGFQDFTSVFSKIMSLIWPIVAGLAAIMIVVAAILFMTANGDPEKIASARQALIWAIIGIVVAILAYSIPMIVKVTIGG